MRGAWENSEFERYEFVSDYKIETLHNRHTTYGLGVPLIAVRQPQSSGDLREKYYPQGLSYAVTAMMRCVPPAPGKRPGESPTCVLEFFDPLVANQIQLANQWVPLETDLTTPLAYFLDSPEFRKRNRATEGLIDPNDSQQKRGVFMLEPYDPKRIPVLMVHGLWSSPLAWMDMFNDLRSFPEIRERYQFWFYLYPSGQPFWLSATQLRYDLAAMREAFDPQGHDRSLDQMVLVGHSMGGLVSRMQTIDSGDDFWKIVSDQPPEKLNGPEEARTKLVSTLFFHPNQSIDRVITIGTPHRGSEFANDYTRWLARKIIKLPTIAVTTGERLALDNPDVIKNKDLLTVANAIDSLDPQCPIFPVMLQAKRDPHVRYHNIIGVLENSSLITGRAGQGDGVVDYDSAHMDDCESELIVNADHTSIHMNGKTIFEVRRILLEHLRDLESRDRVATGPLTTTLSEPIERY
jgi:pimeloyl-ACP methyl ester carboxylesterase